MKKRLYRKILSWVGILAGVTAALGGGYYAYEMCFRVNFHEVVASKVYRSAQPSADNIKQWATKYQLKTIINLRGESDEDFHIEERHAAKEASLELININLSAKRQPSIPNMKKLIDALENADKPMLIHCKAGADRTSIACVLAAMAVGGQDYDEARSQLSVRYFHFDTSSEHIHGLITAYEKWCDDNNRSTASWQQFKHFVLNDYRVYYFYTVIDAPETIIAKSGEVVHVTLSITNDSGRIIPAGDADKTFRISVFKGSLESGWPEDGGECFGPRTDIPKRDIAHGETITITATLRAPIKLGSYSVLFDTIEEDRTFFFRQGSPVGKSKLTVIK